MKQLAYAASALYLGWCLQAPLLAQMACVTSGTDPYIEVCVASDTFSESLCSASPALGFTYLSGPPQTDQPAVVAQIQNGEWHFAAQPLTITIITGVCSTALQSYSDIKTASDTSQSNYCRAATALNPLPDNRLSGVYPFWSSPITLQHEAVHVSQGVQVAQTSVSAYEAGIRALRLPQAFASSPQDAVSAVLTSITQLYNQMRNAINGNAWDPSEETAAYAFAAPL